MQGEEKAYKGNLFDEAGDPTSEYIDECVQNDTSAIITGNDFQYDLSEAYVYLRRLHRDKLNRYLKAAHNITYPEYLVKHGILPQKDHTYWCEQLLQYLNDHFTTCTDGTRIEIKDSYEYSQTMNTVWISASLYQDSFSAGESVLPGSETDTLELAPVFYEENKAFDVVLRSDKTVIGTLNQTCFRSTGLGTYLAPV